MSAAPFGGSINEHSIMNVEQRLATRDATLRLMEALKRRRLEQLSALYSDDATIYSPLLGEVYLTEAIRRLRLFLEAVRVWEVSYDLIEFGEIESRVEAIVKFAGTAKAPMRSVCVSTRLRFRKGLVCRQFDHIDDRELSRSLFSGVTLALCKVPAVRRRLLTNRLGYFEFG